MKFTRPVRAVLFDMDGTLYGQELLRLFMVLELASMPVALGSLKTASRVWQALRVFRQTREELRAFGASIECLDNFQYDEAANRLGADPTFIRRAVAEWMFHRPLRYLPLCRRYGSTVFFDWLRECHFPVGVFSDYPARAKLQALGLSGRAWPVLCATDPEINAFKPHPSGFRRACEIWGLAPDEVLYVGDRQETDAVGAAAAGMPNVIVSRIAWMKAHQDSQNHINIASFEELRHVLIHNIKR
jgi:FMN phosphatase YigB (HAD superfamily)